MVFKNYIRPIVVLLVISILCVGLLAVLNDVLYVSDKVKFDRTMAKIYPGVEFDPQQKVSYKNANYGEVTSVTWAKGKTKGDRVAVIEAVSTGVGYDGGTVTLYVVVKEVAKGGKTVGEIVAWSIKANEKQSFIGKIDGANKWYVGADIANEIAMASNMTSGATMTSNAINMAINVAADYARSVAEMGSNPQKEALDALVAQLAGDYATAEYAALSTTNYKHLAPEGTTLSYIFNATVGTQDVYALVYDVAGTQEFVVFANALSVADKQIVYKSTGITAEVETAVMSTYLSSTANIISVVTEGTTSTYTVVGLKQQKYTPNNYTLQIVVTDGTIASVEIKVSGIVQYDPAMAHSILPALTGKTSVDIDSASSAITAGATQSGNIILNAAKAVLSHYDANNGGAN